MIHVNSAGFCDDQLPLLSTIGRGPVGPQGPKGDDGDVGMPTFADPIEWSPASDYAKFTVVLHDGNSYTSIRDVVAGTDINNEDYWALTGNYDAQVEQYRQEVEAFDGRIEELENTVSPYTHDDTIKSYIDMVNGANPVDYGADPTGANDSTDAINACIADNLNKPIVFTAGLYRISTIDVPYNYTGGSINFNGSTLDSDATDVSIDIGTNPDTTDHGQFATFIGNFRLISEASFAIVIRENFKNARLYNFELRTTKNGIQIGESGTYPGDAYLFNFYIKCSSSLTNNYVGVNIKCTDNKISNGRIYNYKQGVHCNDKDLFISDVHFLVIDAASLGSMDHNCCCINNPHTLYMSQCYCDTYPCFINFNSRDMSNRSIHINNSRTYQYASIPALYFIYFSEIQNNYPGFTIDITNCSITDANVPDNSLYVIYIPENTTGINALKQSLNRFKIDVEIKNSRVNNASRNYTLKTNGIAANIIGKTYCPRYWAALIGSNKWIYIGSIYSSGTSCTSFQIIKTTKKASFGVITEENASTPPHIATYENNTTLQLGCVQRTSNITDVYIRDTNEALSIIQLYITVSSSMTAFAPPEGCSTLLQESAPNTETTIPIVS